MRGADTGGLHVARIHRFIAYRARLVLAIVAVLTLGAVGGIVDIPRGELRLRIETAVMKLLPTQGLDWELYQSFRDRFGNDEILFIGLVMGDVFRPDNLERIKELTKRFKKVDGVRRVVSLQNAPDVRSVDGEVMIRSVYDDVPTSPAEVEELRARVLGNPIHTGTLVSKDSRAAAFLIYPMEMSEREFRRRGIDRTVEAIAIEGAPDARVLMAGTPPLKAATSRILLGDLLRIMPLGFLFMAIISYAIFRSPRAVIVPLSAIGIAQIWTLATMAVTGTPMNLVTFIVPPLINAVGFAYSMHVVSEHDDALREGWTGPAAVERALGHVAFPVILTGITTAAGFLSLCLNRLPAIREFGAFAVIGTLGSLLAALTYAPAVLSLLPDRVPADPGTDGRIEAMANRFAIFNTRYRAQVLSAGGLVVVAALFGLTRINVSTSFTENLKDDNPLRQSIQAFDDHMAGSNTMHVIVEGGEKNAFKGPEKLQQLRELQVWLEEHPKINKTTSLADYVMVVNRAFHDGDPEHYTIPDSRGLISQYLFFLWNDQLEAMVDSRFAAADVMVRVRSGSSAYSESILQDIEAHLAEQAPELDAFVTGDAPMIIRVIDEISYGQAVSLSGATLFIFGILALYFRSLRLAAYALIPNALPVLVYFGVLGLTGVTLNVITSLIACIVLGIAVDDTIHILVRFKEKVALLGDESKAARAALRAVARPVTSTTAALCGGFAVFCLSGLRHQVEFGILATAMLAFAWLVDMTFTPALCSKMGINRND
jgi:predicted RND superfamily exporter protein